MQRRERVIIEDVLADPDFEPHREIAAPPAFVLCSPHPYSAAVANRWA